MTVNQLLDKVYDPKAVEPDMFALWEKSGAFRSKPANTPHERTFTIVIPPPNVTGALHLGHALNNTLQDILVRYHRMRGFNTLWQPGTDHAGIATQAVVEKRIRETEGKTRHDLGREELVRRIWEWKDEYEQRIIGQLKLMGCSCDWERNRFTFDEGLSRAVRHQFFNLFKDGLIFRGKRLVNWDTQLQTAVSDDETYHQTVKGHFWHIKYPVIDPKPGEPEYVIIATTRPETMLGDVAVAVHPDPVRKMNEKEAELRDKLSNASGKDQAEIEAALSVLAERRSTHLLPLVQLRDMADDGRKLRLPLTERVIPLITDDWADPMLGSGCVKITPAHDPNDYQVGVRRSLPMINVLTIDGKVAPIMEPDGTSNAHSTRYEGLSFSKDARAKVVADLQSRDLLHAVEDREIELNHSHRSGLPIEPLLSDQWFLKTADSESEPGASAPDCNLGECATLAPDRHPGEPVRRRRIAPDCDKQQMTAPISSALPPAKPPHRTPDLSQKAVLLTWTTYGTWLPGDKRGFVSYRYQHDGSYTIHNIPGESFDADDSGLREIAERRMKGNPVYLEPAHAEFLVSVFLDVCERHCIEPLGMAIMRNHVHIACQSDRSGPELLQLFKGNASSELNERFALAEAPRWWTEGGSARWTKSEHGSGPAVEYVRDQEYPLRVWLFDQAGDSVDSSSGVQEQGQRLPGSAQSGAEAPGSLTQRLGAPGLAQAAMDAVTDGQIAVFPPRYAKTYLDWLGEKRDWCISRQLWWGHRISVFEVNLHTAVMRRGDESEDDIYALGIAQQDKARKAFEKFLAECGIDTVAWREHRSEALPTWHIASSSTDFQLAMNSLNLIAESQHSRNHHTGDQARDLLLARFGQNALDAANVIHKYIPDSATPGAPLISEDPDVLDTWFSSALWPFSTLGWPEQTEHLKQYYPTSVLVTGRDIITLWVVRMVMFSLYATGKVPFDRVYITPKVLDGRGETMSKSKGNGVDPVDIIDIYGADALRYSIADMTTETQDVRMPVEYRCPHCHNLTDQAAALKAEEQNRKSRGQKLETKLNPADCHRVRCTNKECGKDFATQWAPKELQNELGRAREVSDRFEVGRNFCNKLWNAARFAFMNLEGVRCGDVVVEQLPPEDRWILARLSQTIRRYHQCMDSYQYSASVKELRDFFWDSLCDWYIELTKPRFTGESGGQSGADSSALAKQVLAFCLDQALRLWHPTIPFITERLWQQLNQIAPTRGLPPAAPLTPSTNLVSAEFPPLHGYAAFDDQTALNVFGEIQDVVRGVRDLRFRCNISPKQPVTATVAVPEHDVAEFTALAHIVRQMAGVENLRVDPHAMRPANAAGMAVGSLRVYVHDVVDDATERKRTIESLDALEKQIAGKESKLGNDKFVSNAKPEVVAAERARLEELLQQRQALRTHLAELSE